MFSSAIRYVCKPAFSSCNMLTHVCNTHSHCLVSLWKRYPEGRIPESWNGFLWIYSFRIKPVRNYPSRKYQNMFPSSVLLSWHGNRKGISESSSPHSCRLSPSNLTIRHTHVKLPSQPVSSHIPQTFDLLLLYIKRIRYVLALAPSNWRKGSEELWATVGIEELGYRWNLRAVNYFLT